MALAFNDIVNAAREKSGAPDPDSDSWKEGLEILLRDHAKQNRLTERGQMIVRNRYVETLAARMQVDDHIRQCSSSWQCW